MKRTERLFWKISGGVLLFFAAVPMLLYGIFNMGAWTLLLGGLVCLAVVFLADPILRRRLALRSFRIFRRWLWSLTALVLVVAGVLTGVMLHAAYGSPPPTDQPSTVVVLGCLIRGDQPSLMLRRRLDRALELLEENPQVVCILSGGQGAGEDYTEAWVMEKYLLDKGVDSRRLYREERSTSTAENLRFSAQIQREEGLPDRLAIATDGFHQFRAALLARREGYSQLYALPSGTPWGLVPCYWVREWFGLVKELVFP